jgi:hypothetical protein
MSKVALFESHWKAIKENLCEGRDLAQNMDGTPNPNKKRTMEIVLENNCHCWRNRFR